MHWWQSLLGESLIVALFIGVVAAIAYSLECLSLDQPSQKDTKPYGPEASTQEGRGDANPILRTKKEILYTLVDEYKARESQSYGLQKRNFWLAVIVALVIFGYTTVAALQWCTMQRQLTDSEAIQAVSVSILDFQIHDFPQAPTATFDLRATGETSAQQIAVSLIGIGIKPADAAKYFCSPHTTFTTIVPYSPGSGFELSPTDKPKPITVQIPPLPPTMLDRALIVVVSYRDIFLNEHHVSDCLMYQGQARHFTACACQHERRE